MQIILLSSSHRRVCVLHSLGPLFSTFPSQEGAAGAGGERDPFLNNGAPQNPVPPPPPQEAQKPKRRSWLWMLNPRNLPIIVGGVRDVILVAKPVEHLILNSKVGNMLIL